MKEKGGSFWDIYARSYDAVRSLIPYNELLNEIVRAAEIGSNSMVLDVSCGSGNLSERILSTGVCGLKIEAFDASEEMLEAARRKLAGRPDIKIYRADMNDCFLHADRSFDVVLCSNALYAAKDPAALIVEMARVLRRGGRLVIANPLGVSYSALASIFIEHFACVVERYGFIRTLRQAVKDFSQFLCLIRRNYEIIRFAKKGGYHFPAALELEKMLRSNGCRVQSIAPVYAGTGLLIVAKKVGAAEDVPEIAVRRVDTAAELKEIHRLRYDVYCEYLRSLPPENYPERMESDFFDDRAVHFAAYDRDRLCGALRLIPDGKSGFLMEENFVLPSDLDRARTFELSRLIGRKRHDVLVSEKLFAAAYCYSLERGYRYWIGAWEAHLKRFYAMRGWNFIPLGEVTEYHNTHVVPVLLDLRTISI